MKRITAGLIVLLCASVIGLLATGMGWKTFSSRQYHYTVKYPASWYLFTTSASPELKSLDILNFPPDKRVEGVILKNGGAEISVGPAPPHVHTLEQWIARDTKLRTQVTRHELGGFNRSTSVCSKLTEITALSEVGPGRNFVVTGYYCATKEGLYGTQLLNWQGDKKQKEYQEIALRMAKSIRLPSGNIVNHADSVQ